MEPDSSVAKQTRGRRLVIRCLVAGTVIAVMLSAIWLWPQWDRETFLIWRREAGPVPFFIALAVLPALGFPTSPFYVLAGATFSPIENAIGITLSLAVNVIICFAVSRSALRPAVEWLLRRTSWELPQLQPGQALRFALLVKMTPGVGTFLKNYIIALAGVRFPLYFAVCFSVTAVYAAAFVLLGESLVDRDYGLGAVAVAAFILVGVVLFVVRQRLGTKAPPDHPPG